MSNRRTRSRAANHQYHFVAEHMNEAQRLFDLGNWAQSGKVLNRVLKAEPDHLGALELLARSFWRRQVYAEALQTLDRLVTLNPYEPGYFYLQGLVYQGLGRVQQAISSFSRCLGEEDARLAEQAATAIRELMKWQQESIRELIDLDREFAIKYAQNAKLACQERGFCFEAPANLVNWLRPTSLTELVWDRPS